MTPLRICTFVLLVWNAGCQVHEPVDVIGGCVAPVIQSISTDVGTVNIKCDFERAVFLVAVPSRTMTMDELTKIGVLNDPASNILRGTIDGSRWCTIDKVLPPPSSPPENIGWNVQCVSTAVVIDTLAGVDSRAFILGFRKSSDGSVHLDSFEPAR